METLTEMIIENGYLNENNMILKMDCEAAEWDVFNDLTIDELLLKFKYIIVKFHSINAIVTNRKLYDKFLNAINKITKYHQSFHIHVPTFNWVFNTGNVKGITILEVFFIRKKM